MGDTPHPFNKLAARMALPQTAWLAVQAPWLLPFDMGRTWIEMFRSDGLGM
jgi:hypothetical protein